MNIYKLRKSLLKIDFFGKILKKPYMAVKNYILKQRADIKMNNLLSNISKNKKRILYLDVPIHPNMGDLAQYCCIKDWINKYYSNYDLIEIDADVMLRSKKRFIELLTNLQKDDLIFFQSGYCTQDLGGTHDEVHRLVVDNAKNIPIIMLQQTILYNNPDNAKRTATSYAAHKRLMIIARDKLSFEYAKNLFPNNTLDLMPDFVTSWIGTKECKAAKERKGILVCCRNDIEKYYSAEEILKLVDTLKKIDNVEVSDTTIQCDFSSIKSNIYGYVHDMIEKFSNYRVIITDRYHGTIFSLVAGTPVIVIKSNDHKVITGVNWFKGYYDECVRYVDNIELVSGFVRDIYEKYNYKKLEQVFLQKYFEALPQKIEQL